MPGCIEQAENKHLEENFTEWLKEYRKQGDRLAELEEIIKPFERKFLAVRAALEKSQKHGS